MGETAPEVMAGQIWKEVDPRVNRFVRVVEVRSSRTAIIERVVSRIVSTKPSVSSIWERAGRRTQAHPSRFNGKRGGYEFIGGPNV